MCCTLVIFFFIQNCLCPLQSQLLTTLTKKSFENIFVKGENAGNQHFLLFPPYFLPFSKQVLSFHSNLFCCLPMLSIWTCLKFCNLVRSKLYSKQRNFQLTETGKICRQQNKCDLKIKCCCWKGRKHCGKRRKYWLPAFSPFPTMFSEGYFLRVIRNRDCGVKS